MAWNEGEDPSHPMRQVFDGPGGLIFDVLDETDAVLARSGEDTRVIKAPHIQQATGPVELEDAMRPDVGDPDRSVGIQTQAVGDAYPGTPRAQEPPLGIEDHDRVRSRAALEGEDVAFRVGSHGRHLPE